MNINNNFGSGFNASASGIRDAQLRMNIVANNVANSNTDNFVPNRVNSSANSLEAGGGVNSSVESAYTPFQIEGLGKDFISQTSLIEEAVNLSVAKHAYEANALMVKTGSEVTKTLIDMLG